MMFCLYDAYSNNVCRCDILLNDVGPISSSHQCSENVSLFMKAMVEYILVHSIHEMLYLEDERSG